jgi:iron(III) transport system substrate-binding protein
MEIMNIIYSKKYISLFLCIILSLLVIPRQGMTTGKEVIEGAKKESKLVLYLSHTPEEAKAFLNAFSKKYPFIETEFYKSPAFRLDEKFKAEVRAGKTYADVMYTTLDTPMLDYKRMGLLVPYRSPEYAGMFKEAVEPEGYWAAWKYMTMGIVVNSKVLAKSLWPTDWTDFINPKAEWKGLLITPDPTVSSSAYIWLYGMKQRFGLETTKKILEGMKKMDVSVMLAFADGMTKASTGEKAIVTDMLLEHHIVHKKKGAPIVYIIPKSGVILFRGVGGLVNNAPHPNAGKLFIDFMCSKEGQTFLAETVKNYPTRPDVELPSDIPEFLPLDKINVIAVDEIAAVKETQQLVEMWKKVLGR